MGLLSPYDKYIGESDALGDMWVNVSILSTVPTSLTVESVLANPVSIEGRSVNISGIGVGDVVDTLQSGLYS